MDPTFDGSMARWIQRSIDPWFDGPNVGWIYGSMDPTIDGSMFRLTQRSMDPIANVDSMVDRSSELYITHSHGARAQELCEQGGGGPGLSFSITNFPRP